MPHALLSDIHGNMRAFDAVLGELARFGIDSGLVLGDVPTNTNEEIGEEQLARCAGVPRLAPRLR